MVNQAGTADTDAVEGDAEAVTAVDLSSEEWRVVRALRDRSHVGPATRTPAPDGQEDLEATFERLEHGIFENMTATLDRMLARADQTSHQLDVLLGRLAETSPSWRPAA